MSSYKKSDKKKSAALKRKRRKNGSKSKISARLSSGKSRLRAPIHYAAYVATALFLVLVDPFQWKEITDTASQDLAYRVLIGPLYPTDHRDDITVVLFNEATLRYLGTTWPTSLGEHAKILSEIREMGPRAVMVDFVFPDKRLDQTVEKLRDEIQAFKNANNGASIPLYFARAEGTNIDWIRPDLYNATLTSVVNGISDGVSRTYEPCSKLSGGRSDCACDAGTNEFQACPAEARPATPGSPVALTAAFQLFGYPEGLKHGFDIQDPIQMEVVWSNRLNPINASWMRKQTPWGLEDLCVDIAPNIGDWLQRIWLKSEQYSFRQTCPYATTVAAHNLLRAPGDPELRKVISNKFVFYGADLTGLEDTVVPPTHVKLPGVYLHAMALDNLLTFGGDYKRSSMSIFFGADIAAEHITTAVAVLIALIVVVFARSKRASKARKIKTGQARGVTYLHILWRRWKHWLLFNLCSLSVILVAVWVLYSGFAISPKNWLGYWGLLLVLSSMAKGQLIEVFFAKTVEHLVPSFGPVIFTEKRK